MHRLLTPSAPASSVGASLHSPILTGFWEGLALIPAYQGSPQGSLPAARSIDTAPSQLSTMDICHQGSQTVATESPRHVSGPEEGRPSPDSLHLPSGPAHVPPLTCPVLIPFSPTWGLIPSMVLLLPPSWSLHKHLLTTAVSQSQGPRGLSPLPQPPRPAPARPTSKPPAPTLPAANLSPLTPSCAL